MDHEEEYAHAELVQFKRDRWLYATGHLGATASLICLAWTVADHKALLWFGVVHHVATWVLVLSIYLPLKSEQVTRIPLWTYLGVALVNATLSSALLLDLNAARDLTFTLVVGIILFAGAAGSFVTLGVHSKLVRVALTSLLLPYVIITFYVGHVVVSIGTVFFYLNNAIVGVWKLSSGQKELVATRSDAVNLAARAQQEAETDHLTGLVNRRGLERLDGMELSNGVTALYFDVNKFKAINDTYGHTVGDEILQIVAQRLRAGVAASDIVARLGGDEFLVLIFTDEMDNIDSIIDRLSEQIQQPAKVSGELELEISAAVGYSQCLSAQLKLDELLRDSDHAMYHVKGSLEKTATVKKAG